MGRSYNSQNVDGGSEENDGNIFSSCEDTFEDTREETDLYGCSPMLSYDNAMEYFSDDDDDANEYFEETEADFNKDFQHAILQSMAEGEGAAADWQGGGLFPSRRLAENKPSEVLSRIKCALGTCRSPAPHCPLPTAASHKPQPRASPAHCHRSPG